MATLRDELRALADLVPEASLPQAVQLLRDLTSLRSLREILDEAPIDDEPVTAADLAAIEEAAKAYAEGRTIPLSIVREKLRRKREAAREAN
jgi:hypothetical protein